MMGLHWITPLLLVAVYVFAISIDMSTSRDAAMWRLMMHRSFGLTVLLLTVFRLAWRQVVGVPALPQDVPRLQRLAARLAAIGLYTLLLVQPLLGIVASQLHGDRISVFGIVTLPLMSGVNRAVARNLIGIHRTVAILLLILIALHAMAAHYHHFIRRDHVLLGMLPIRRTGAGTVRRT